MPVPPTSELVEIGADIASRAECATGTGAGAGKDNILALVNVLRSAALDVRLQNARPSGPQKVDVAADKITEIWREHAATIYGDSPTPGALQVVFADRWAAMEISDSRASLN